MEFEFEGAGHANAVLVHLEPAVGLRGRERTLRHQVVLVGCVHHPATQAVEEDLLPLLDQVDDPLRLGERVFTHALLGRELGDAERDDGDARKFRETLEHTGQGVVEDIGVVDPGTRRSGRAPRCRGRARPAASATKRHHDGSSRCRRGYRVSGMDGDVDRRQPLRDDPFEVEFGEAGEGGEVPVEERESVVVVLQVQQAPHALGQLVDEAELAVVVAGLHLVEQRRVDFCPEGFAGVLGDDNVETPVLALLQSSTSASSVKICQRMTSRRTSPATADLVTGLKTRPSSG